MAEQPKQPIELRFSGALNNFNTPLDLYLRKKGEVPILRNADLTLPGIISPLKGLLPLNSTAGADIHSIFVGNAVKFVVDGVGLKYLRAAALTALGSLTASTKVRWAHAGNWIFIANGTDRKAIYIPTPVMCDWGIAIPTVAPTVTDSTVASTGATPFGVYSCYYRYRITLPDGTIILTALSPVRTVDVTTVGGAKISWVVPAAPTFTGATTVATDLFRTSTTMSGTYLVATLASGTTTYTDDLTDAALQLLDYYDETGYYPPQDSIKIVKYYPAADRVFATVGPDAYWSEAGQYHVFLYSAVVAEYANVNSVFLPGDDITAVKRIDENLYFGSAGTWRRLRGRSPDSWSWEDTMAAAGPINDESAVETPWGIIHPAADGTMWLFTGNTSRSILDEFVFTMAPGQDAHASFDGRFYRLFYEDPTYPELVVDFLKYPEIPPRIVQSTRSATASHYDKNTGQFYMADAQYLRNGANSADVVALTIKTPDIPLDGLLKLGGRSILSYKANTQGEDLTVTPYADEVALAAFVINTTISKRDRTPLPFGDAYTLSLLLSITTAAAVTI